MKRLPPILIAGILVSILITPLTTSALASLKTQVRTPELRVPKTDYPIGEPCEVTVDALPGPRTNASVQGNSYPGFIRTDVIKGVLTRVDDSWLVLKEGTYENWIPRNKILLVRVSL